MNSLLDDGIIFFNAGQFYEAHEIWEDLWRESGGPLRLYYQGLVQAAVGLHHLNRGNLDGARSVVARAVEKLAQYPSRFCGIDNAGLVADLKGALREMKPCPIRITRLE